MEHISSQAIDPTSMNETSKLWEKYSSLDPNFPAFLQVVEKSFEELSLVPKSPVNFRRIQIELEYWIGRACRNLTGEVLSMIDLLGKIRLLSDQMYSEDSIKIITLLVQEVTRRLVSGNAATEIFRAAFECVKSFSHFIEEVLIFESNSEFTQAYAKLVRMLCKEILQQTQVMKIEFLQIIKELIKGTPKKQFFIGLCVREKEICACIIDIFKGSIIYSREFLTGESKIIAQILLDYTKVLMEENIEYIDYLDFQKMCHEISLAEIGEGTQYIKFLLKGWQEEVDIFNAKTCKYFEEIIGVLLLPRIDKDVYEEYCTKIRTMQVDPRLNNALIISNSKLKILKSNEFPRKISLLDSFLPMLRYHFPVIELKHLLNLGITYPDTISSILNLILHATERAMQPSKYFIVQASLIPQFRLATTLEFKEITIILSFFLHETNSPQSILSIYNECFKTELTITAHNSMISLHLISPGTSEQLADLIKLKANQWNFISLSFSIKPKIIQKQEIVLIVNSFEYKLYASDALRSLSIISYFEVRFSGYLEYLYILANVIPFSVMKLDNDSSMISANLPSLINSEAQYMNSVVFKWCGDSMLPESSYYSSEFRKPIAWINHVSIYESLAAIGGVKILLLLINHSKTESNFVLLFEIMRAVGDNSISTNLLDEDLFVTLKSILQEGKIEFPLERIIKSLKAFLISMKSQELYPVAVENILMNNAWLSASDELLVYLFDTLIIHNIKYSSTMHMSSKIEYVCKYFNSFIKALPENKRGFIYPYYFYVLEKIIEEVQDPSAFLLIIGKVLEESSGLTISNHFPKLINLIKQRWRPKIEQGCYLLDLLKISKVCIDNGNGLESQLLKFVFDQFFGTFELFYHDTQRNRYIDFKTDFNPEAQLLVKIYENLEYLMYPSMKEEVCVEIIEFIKHDKFKKILQKSSPNIAKSINFMSLITENLSNTLANSILVFDGISDHLSNQCKHSNTILKNLIKDTSFPGWTFEIFRAYNSGTEKFLELIVLLFSKMTLHNNFNKLRILVSFLCKSRINKVFSLIFKILECEFSKSSFTESYRYLIEMLNIVEDLTFYSHFIDSNLEDFKKIVKSLIELSDKYTKYSLNFPRGPGIEFYDQINTMIPIPNSDTMIYFRDGGICRQLLKLVFFTLKFELDISLEKQLFEILTRKATEKEKELEKIKEKGIERLSFLPIKTKKNMTEFIYLYAFIEWHKIITIYKDIGYTQERLSSLFYSYCEKCNLRKKINKVKKKEILNSFQQNWHKIQDVLEKCSPSLEQKYKNLLENPFNFSPSEISESITTFEKSNQVSPVLETYLTLLTSLKMDILSDKYLIGIIPYDYHKNRANHLSRSNSEHQPFQRIRLDIESSLSKIKTKNLLKSLSQCLYPPNDENGIFYLNSSYDNLGRKPFLQRKIDSPIAYFRKSSSTSEELFQKTYDPDVTGTFVGSVESSQETRDSFDAENVAILNEEEVIGDASQKLLELECEVIFIKGYYYGKIVITDEHLVFYSTNHEKTLGEGLEIDEDTKEYVMRASSLPGTQIKKEKVKVWGMHEIKEIITRRFIHTYCAIEIFLKCGKSMFLNFFTHKKCIIALGKLKSLESKFEISILSRNTITKYMVAWKSGKISNFDYLLVLNKYAGRSFNDLSQYPVFPWVIKDFKSEELDLNSEETFRNLKFPMGAQSSKGKQVAERRYSISSNEDFEAYHYGSHYSNGGIVLHYLLRLEPFTRQSRILQGGKFDVPDRMFASLSKTWTNGQEYSSDVKEMIPELFYLPEMLVNINNLDLGIRQNKRKMNNVSLPKWANNSEFNFIRYHKKAIESRYVSQNLHHWIDLIFGYKQQGEEAKRSFNIFYPLTYEQNFLNIMKTADSAFHTSSIHQVVHFGQTPIQIIASRHPKRDEIPQKYLISERIMKKSEFYLEQIVQSPHLLLSILCTSKYLLVIKFSVLHTLLRFKFTSDSVEISNMSEFELQGLPLTKDICATIFKEDLIATGGYENCCIYINNTSGELLSIYKHHSAPVRCISGGYGLASGSEDSTLVFFTKSEKRLLHGHLSRISHVCTIDEWALVISASEELVLIHDYRSGLVVRQFKINCLRLQANNNGVVFVETADGYRVFYVNGQEMYRMQKNGHHACCLASEVLIYEAGGKFFAEDFYDRKCLDIELDMILEPSMIIYDLKKDAIFVIEKTQKTTLMMLKDSF